MFSYDFPKIRNLPKIFLRSFENVVSSLIVCACFRPACRLIFCLSDGCSCATATISITNTCSEQIAFKVRCTCLNICINYCIEISCTLARAELVGKLRWYTAATSPNVHSSLSPESLWVYEFMGKGWSEHLGSWPLCTNNRLSYRRGTAYQQ